MIDRERVVAAFDFDGTLTTRDSLIPFLLHHAGLPGFVHGMTSSAGVLLAYGLRMLRNDMAKERLLARFFAGSQLAELEQSGKQFARTGLPKLLRPDSLRRMQWHQQQGHRVVIVSASLDIYLKPWAETAGVNDVLCSSLARDDTGTVSGRLAGGNCFGPEKLNRLVDFLGDRSAFTLYAYGDSRGDRELLNSADYAFYRTMPAPE
jgi:phosphatidylglycerophosphatase C